MNDPNTSGLTPTTIVIDEAREILGPDGLPVKSEGRKLIEYAKSLVGLESAMQDSLERLSDVHSMNRAEIRRAVIGGKKIRGRRASQGRILDKGNAKAVSKRHALRLVAKQARKVNR